MKITSSRIERKKFIKTTTNTNNKKDQKQKIY